MEDDKVAKFIDTRDEQVLEDCTKAQLQLIADHFGIKLKSSKVGERRLEIVAQLRARDEALREERPQTPASAGENLSIGGSSRGSSGSRRSVKLEIMKLQLEAQLKREEQEREAQLRREEAQLKREEAQLKREEREAEALLRWEEPEHEAQLKHEEREAEALLRWEEPEHEAQLKHEERETEAQLKREEREAQLKREDHKAEGFFDHFERVATLKKWPRAEWAELIQGRLTGEAREAYNMLDVKECTNYEAVKRAVLLSFKLTPECYRKRIRECARSPGKSYAETARDMERKFLK
ncbi:trichohyalin-like [Procambarus clarkii]|uniref:trichohyalin-like n=1 Tax=Procambarus clarkii TaxID=6728 RepID=UPI0037435531